MFNTKIWLSDAVRTSKYVYPDDIHDYGNLNIGIDELIKSFVNITHHDLPVLQGALLPARLPRELAIPNCILEHWDSLIEGLSTYAGTLHPTIKQLILSLALNDDSQDIRVKRLEKAKNLFIEGTAYQPTITWVSLLFPDWYSAEQKISPAIRGGNIVDSNKGVTVSLVLTQDKIRINPATLFTSNNIIDIKDALIMSSSEIWNSVALTNKELDYPLVTSNWLYALASKESFWEDVSVGGALYSPYYTDNEVDMLVVNHCNEQGPGFYFRPGNGISDIYPIISDPALSSLFKPDPLFDAPFWTGMACAIYNLVSHNGSPVGLPLSWFNDLLKEIKLTESMGILPAYSAFSQVDVNGTQVESVALDILTRIVEDKDVTQFSGLLESLLLQQQKLSSMYDGVFMDSAATGYPHSFRHLIYAHTANNNSLVMGS